MCQLRSGAIRKAKGKDAGLGDFPEEWRRDPWIVVSFRAKLLSHTKGAAEASDFLAREARKIKDRYVTTWIELKLAEAKLRSRLDRRAAAAVAERALARCEELGLERRAEEARAFL